MKKGVITKTSLKFLQDLQDNNYRDWFNANRDRYETAFENMQEFAGLLIQKMEDHDQLVPKTPKQSLHRIYRDTRFSKDKTPYKNHWGGGLKRDTKWLRGGYYYHIQPGGTFVAGGFWGPSSPDLLRIRKEFEASDKEMRDVIASPMFQKFFGELEGVGVKTAPRGFAKDHPALDLIRKKQFVVRRSFSDKDVLAPNFVEEVNKTFQAMRPFFNYMSDVLTTDLNGVPLD